MKQAEILDNPIPQDIESWFKENKGNEFWFDGWDTNYGILDSIEIKKDIIDIYFDPIVNRSYILNGKLVGFRAGVKEDISTMFRLKKSNPQSEFIKLPFYIHTDHPNNIIQLLQNGQKPKVTIQIDNANDMQLAKHIMDFLNAEL